MKLIFAKTKRARILCALLALIMLALAVLAGYFTVGNLLCAARGAKMRNNPFFDVSP